jgi:predicted RNA-binding Zn-ribbon protein involved in translation (DUF1610 family)
MAEGENDLLLHGRAAALAGLRDEARFYLEWALQRDLDYADQEEAWWWLSQVTDDPAERRNNLENVLALNPGHGGARRELAILDGRLAPGALRDPYAPVAPLAPSTSLDTPQVRHYSCPQCGAGLGFDPGRGALACGASGYQLPIRPAPEAAPPPPPALRHVFCPQCGSKIALAPASESLHCQFCGHERAITPEDVPAPEAAVLVVPPAPVAEQDFVVALNTPGGHRWVLPTARVLTCQGCGAVVTLAPAQVSMRCPFCGSAHVVVGQAHPDLLAPEGVLPFRVTAAQALQAARTWLAAARFRPGDLDARATLATPRPIYLPVWTFDITGELSWRGYETVHEPATRRPVIRPVMRPVYGSAPILYDDLLVLGTPSLPEELLAGLRFDTHALAPYTPDLLANWPAEIYRRPVADASLRAREQAAQATAAQLAGNPPSGLSDWQITGSNVSVLSYKLVLLPVWLTEYGYGGQQYPLVVNGHSGQAEGVVPRTRVQRVLDTLFGGE